MPSLAGALAFGAFLSGAAMMLEASNPLWLAFGLMVATIAALVALPETRRGPVPTPARAAVPHP